MTLLPLDMHQRQDLLAACLASARTTGDDRPCVLDAQHLGRLQRLDQLTPGDFANISRRLTALLMEPTAALWLDELESEHQAKPGAGRRSMGFV